MSFVKNKEVRVLSRLISILSVFVILSILAITISAFTVNYWLQQPLALSEEKIISIRSGDTLSKVSYQLEKEKILSYPKLFTLYAKLTGRTRLEVGEYRLSVGVTPEELLAILQSGDVVVYSVTLVEGKTFKDFINVLGNQEKLETILADKSFEKIKEQLNLEVQHPEGWFYPDTYQYASGTTDADILLQAHKKMQVVLAEEWQQRAESLPYKNAYEALVMASIIEKETGVAYERAEIAGVFVRRLKKGMRLQTDPTIIYGLGDKYKGNIRRKHLTQVTPYNTYVINGLPPTPIAMPGREAIHAALHPTEGKSLFFVAKGDGSHQFSETLEQHNKAVQNYQIKNRAKKYQSSPNAK